VDRVLSAYEFAVEVAARVLNRPKEYKPDPTKVNTRDVWPWSQLVPFIEEDMVQRVRGRATPLPQAVVHQRQTSMGSGQSLACHLRRCSLQDLLRVPGLVLIAPA